MMVELMGAWLLSGAATVPLEAAENRRGVAPRAGVAAPGPDGEITLTALLRALRADAAQHSARDAASLRVLPVEEVAWSDGALGCPQPGRVYTQALVPGWRVRIQAGPELLSYHASRRGPWVLCPAGQPVTPLPGSVPR